MLLGTNGEKAKLSIGRAAADSSTIFYQQQQKEDLSVD
jgi:hypothetical protein